MAFMTVSIARPATPTLVRIICGCSYVAPVCLREVMSSCKLCPLKSSAKSQALPLSNVTMLITISDCLLPICIFLGYNSHRFLNSL